MSTHCDNVLRMPEVVALNVRHSARKSHARRESVVEALAESVPFERFYTMTETLHEMHYLKNPAVLHRTFASARSAPRQCREMFPIRRLCRGDLLSSALFRQ